MLLFLFLYCFVSEPVGSKFTCCSSCSCFWLYTLVLTCETLNMEPKTCSVFLTMGLHDQLLLCSIWIWVLTRFNLMLCSCVDKFQFNGYIFSSNIYSETTNYFWNYVSEPDDEDVHFINHIIVGEVVLTNISYICVCICKSVRNTMEKQYKRNCAS